MKTIGECLRNNWNSLNVRGEEGHIRAMIQNKFATNSEFDKEFYLKYLWNDEVEE